MRLLNVKTLQLEEFVSQHKKSYGILSHRWEDDEISYEEMIGPNRKSKQGYKKIEAFCQKFQEEFKSIPYVWIDTCCIDKRSSAELSEAINSMYKWYRDSTCCFAFLSDVDDISDFEQSVWFTRSWTLQELIAPRHLQFYNKKWECLGTRNKLEFQIVNATGIDSKIFHRKPVNEFSVAQRMSWAAERKATRIEDEAYSLMGLFDVNMPMLYGEGEKSFVRLQEEIIRQSDDHSIFAWSMQDTQDSNGYLYYSSGMLASSPYYFKNCQNVIRKEPILDSEGYSMTNAGLSIKLIMLQWDMELFCAVLDCTRVERKEQRMGIFLRQLPQRRQYARMPCGTKDCTYVDDVKLDTSELFPGKQYDGHRILVRQIVPIHRPLDLYGFHIQNIQVTGRKGPKSAKSIRSQVEWKPKERLVLMPTGYSGTACTIDFEPDPAITMVRFIKLAFDPDFNPVIMLAWNWAKEHEALLMSGQNSDAWIHQAISLKEAYAVITRSILRGDSEPFAENALSHSCAIRVPKDQGLEATILYLEIKISLKRVPASVGHGQIWSLNVDVI